MRWWKLAEQKQTKKFKLDDLIPRLDDKYQETDGTQNQEFKLTNHSDDEAKRQKNTEI